MSAPKVTVSSPEAQAIARLRERDLLSLVERHARAHHVTVEDVCGRGRTASVTAARRAVWRELRETTTMSYPDIGRLFGRDHSTVIAAMRGTVKARALIEGYAKLRVV